MKKAALSLIAMGVVLMIVFAAIFVIAREYLPLLYNNEVEVVTIAASLLIFAALFQISDGIR